MANIKNINNLSEKKLILNDFLPVEILEVIPKEEEGPVKYKEEYIYIKKLPRTIQKKIQILSSESIKGEKGKNFIKKLKASGYTLNDLKKVNSDNALEFLEKVDLDEVDLNELNYTSTEAEKLILNNGINKTKHTFKDEHENSIELNYDFWEHSLNDEALIIYIINEIKKLSKGFSLGK
jgi:hypothetical protein